MIKKRAEALRYLGQKKRESFYRSCVGKTFQVLAEGLDRSGAERIKGLSDNYLTVLFPFPHEIKSEILPVRIDRIEGCTVHGSRVTENGTGYKAHGLR